MKKMMNNPDQMTAILTEMEALKLNSSEKKEAKKRMQQDMMKNAGIDESIQKKAAGKMNKEEIAAMKKTVTEQQSDKISKETGLSKEYVKKRVDDFDRIIPEKDFGRINALPQNILTRPELKALLASFHKNTLELLPGADRSKADEIFGKLKSAGTGSMQTGNIANSLWLADANFLAICLMSKTCQEDLTNINNLNNYAAYLTMYGAEEIALPVLQHLNQQHPGNATILNNIAQAWFGLGELNQAYKYIDSTITKFPKHSQANLTKSLIEEVKGNKEGAIESAKKSLEEGWSETKRQQLERMGYRLTPGDIKVTVPADPMGLEKYIFPEFPKSYQQAVLLSGDWAKFSKSCADEANKIKQKVAYLQKQQYPIDKRHTIIADGKYKKLLSLYGDGDGAWSRKREQLEDELEETYNTIEKLKKAAGTEIDKVGKKYEDKCGEGTDCPEKDICNDYRLVHDQFINKANSLLQPVTIRYFDLLRKSYNADVYLSQYSMENGDFEIYKAHTQIRFLEEMSLFRFPWMGILPAGSFPNACDPEQGNSITRFKGLPDYDDIKCNYISTLEILFTKMVTRCNKMTTTVKIDGKLTGIPALKDVKLEIGFTEDINRKNPTILPTQIIGATIEIGVKLGGKEWELGASKDELKAGVKAEAGVIIEVDKSGITDVGVKMGVGLSGGTSQVPVATSGDGQGGASSVNLVGAEARWSVKAGPSLKGKSVFKDLRNVNYSQSSEIK